ncbi:MAG: S-adenosylmethionine:tRNA ribosyltransferase-isomerase [Bdellovibrionaceae bacterium]|nr:S-adenosylmethionine:tRNA ribosyltransferase-isomerase [Pseudobdellovibrionaceae bacterium]MDW8190687.1 S-adenosylmethionine:tRNA ribosyltransferase-isomerase [Pseudobdellovibrionaceae bacterium]
MKKSDLTYSYPAHLVATEPRFPSRILRVPQNDYPREITRQELFDEISAGDVLVINRSRVLPRRLFSSEGIEILFIKPINQDRTHWEVLFPAAKSDIGDLFELPSNLRGRLHSKGMPQILEMSAPLEEDYFRKHGELPLPPYILRMRGERHALPEDIRWYQPDWAQIDGSLASPTASLHFRQSDLDTLQAKGVIVAPLILHVGLGTFLPIKTDDLDQHQMHEEYVEIPYQTWEKIEKAKHAKKSVWALGTTVTRALESVPLGELDQTPGGWVGWTKLFIRPGFRFQIVNRLLTNFHQPESTLLALVAALQGVERMKQAYQLAIELQFRLFSYGDLSVWDVHSTHG